MDVVIYGTGGFAREVHQIVEDSNAREATLELPGLDRR